MALDVLEILIEADARGLETQLKRAGDKIVDFVEKMNSQTVNWESIIAGSLNTAIISGIAATFALAIEQTVAFQNSVMNMNNVATPATQSFADSLNQIGGQAYQLAQSSGQGIGDAASAFEAFSKAGLDSAAATYAVNEASGIAYATNQSFSTVVSELVGLFQNWGVTTTPQVTSALTGLANAAQNGKFTFDELVNAMTPQGAFLETKTNISDTAISLAELSTHSNLTKDAILDTFSQIATAASQGLANPINNIVGSMSKTISSGPDGLITAFSKIGDFINQAGPSMAGVYGNAIGVMSADTASFENTSTASFQASATAADSLKSHLTPIDDIIAANMSATDKLKISWNNFQTALDQFIIPASITALETVLSDMTASIDLINGFFAKSSVAGGGSKTGNMANSTPSGGLDVNSFLNSTSIGSQVSPETQLMISGLGNAISASMINFLKNSSNGNSSQNNPVPNATSVNLNITNSIVNPGGTTAGVPSINTQTYNQFQGIH